ENEYDSIVLEHFKMDKKPFKVPAWEKFLKSLNNPVTEVKIAVVGKYISLQDSYKSIYEAILHGAAANQARLDIMRVDSEDLEKKPESVAEVFRGVDGILVPGGFGDRGIEGKIMAISHARRNGIPFFGICLGLQCAVIEFARNVCGMAGANSREFDPETPYPVISLLEDQEIVLEKGGTMRLGAYLCRLDPESRVRAIYGTDSVMERHRHRYEFTNRYRELFEKNGMVFGGIHPTANLVETVEVPGHPWFVATQFHPEFKSRPVKPHPLFRDFIRASIQNRKG
ncbi:MAG TPA: CTP synthase, partial [Spirochaetota bacterium]|nr:CTP synthase [Spirochaetota bacterium]